MIDRLEELVALLEELLGSAFDVDRYTATAWEPAAPSGACDAVWAWIASVEDRRAFVDDCLTVTDVTYRYRIDVCYPENDDGRDQTDAQHLATVDKLYGMMEAVWCGLVAEKDAGTLLSSPCDYVRILPLEVQQRSGGIVSALGGVVAQFPC